MHNPTDRITHTMAFVTPVVEHWLEREIAQWVHPMKDRSDNPSHHEQMLLPRSYISLPLYKQFTFCHSLFNLKLQSQLHIVVNTVIVNTSVICIFLFFFIFFVVTCNNFHNSMDAQNHLKFKSVSAIIIDFSQMFPVNCIIFVNKK